MTNGIGMIIDGLVAILLMLTIGYCIMLNRRLKLLKADEQSLRATISELVTATEIAERAIGGLKLTVHECDIGLGERLRKAERVTHRDRPRRHRGQGSAWPAVADRDRRPRQRPAVAALNEARRGQSEPEIKSDASFETSGDGKVGAQSRAKAVAAAAEAFAERLRNKVHGLAA